MPPKADLQGSFLPVVNVQAIVFYVLKKKGKQIYSTYPNLLINY